MAKSFILPDSNDISFSWKLEGNASEPHTGVKYKVSLYVDGKYIVLKDWYRATGAQDLITVNISDLAGINLNSLRATVIIEVRDSGINNGVGEVAWFRSFSVTGN